MDAIGDKLDEDFHLLLTDNSPTAQTALVLTLTAQLEHSLMEMLDKFFMVLKCGRCEPCKKGARCKTNDTIFAPKETLESFSKCADLSLRTGLVTPLMRETLSHIGSIRNRFAHHACLIDFDDIVIKQHCQQLRTPKWAGKLGKFGGIDIAGDGSNKNRDQFVRSFVWMFCAMQSAASCTKRCVSGWPEWIGCNRSSASNHALKHWCFATNPLSG